HARRQRTGLERPRLRAAALRGELEAVRGIRERGFRGESALDDAECGSRRGRRRRAATGNHGDREVALRLRGPAPLRGGWILVAEIDVERPAALLSRGTADEAAERQRQPGRKLAADERVLVRQRGAAAARSAELLAVGLAD